MMHSHSAPCGGKSSARHRTPQIVLRIAVTARKLWTGELQNGFHLSSGNALRQEAPGDPKVHNAPVRPMETFPNLPSLQTVLVDGGSFAGRDRGRKVAVGDVSICGRPCWSPTILRGLDQRISLQSQTRTGMHDLHPGSEAALDTPARLLIGEAGESTQVSPVRTARIAVIFVSQLSGHCGCNAPFQPEVATRIQACR